MKLSNLEKETIILWNEAEKAASVYTHTPALQRQLCGLCQSHPGQVRQTGGSEENGMTFELPKRWLKISPPRTLSPAQREVLERMNRIRHGPVDGDG